MKPMFMMMVGLPYSGKSCYAEKLKEEFNAVVHSSDAIREEILGDVQDQNNNGKVFDVLHRRVIEDLSNGRNVIYDATNINYKRRMDTIQRLSKVPCEKVCEFMATPLPIAWSAASIGIALSPMKSWSGCISPFGFPSIMRDGTRFM